MSKTGKLLIKAGYRVIEGNGFEYASKDYDGRNFGLSYPLEDVKKIGAANMAACVAEKFRGFTPPAKENDSKNEETPQKSTEELPQRDFGDEADQEIT